MADILYYTSAQKGNTNEPMERLALVLLIAVTLVGCASQTTTSQPSETSQTGRQPSFRQTGFSEITGYRQRFVYLRLQSKMVVRSGVGLRTHPVPVIPLFPISVGI